ncbi:MAG: metal-sulfur cluster assembly factor [Clostridia bacterium]|jgi:metal-sulfur cluster biosynthetic enzyme|nr:metal-sulfur cluster assembly factor [Spirochaetia bacterium]
MDKHYTESDLLEILKDVEDPELGFSIVDLGLVYRTEHKAGVIEVDFTLTSPGCPMSEQLGDDIVRKLKKATGVANVKVQLVWNPPWTEEKASDEVKLAFGYPIW